MMIPDEKIAEVRERAGIVEVISDYISLKKSGANFQGLCPFHGEKTPSFNVNPGRGIFHCFGCGVGGNAVTFVMKMEGISFPEAVKLLAKRVGVEIEERLPTASEVRRKSEKEEQLKIISHAADYYHSRLQLNDPEGGAARSYLAGRGIGAEIFTPYRLGYASERWDGLANFLKQKGIPLEQVEKLGLIKLERRQFWERRALPRMNEERRRIRRERESLGSRLVMVDDQGCPVEDFLTP